MTTSIKTINRRAGLAVAAVPLLAGLAVLAGPAHADTATARAASTSGSCSSHGAFINFSAFYHNSSRYHVFTSYAWTIGGSGVRNKNNVEVPVFRAAFAYGQSDLTDLSYSRDTVPLLAATSRTLDIWTTNPQALPKMLCASIGDVITRQQWSRYVPDIPYQQPCR
jgi:hypothetical protein